MIAETVRGTEGLLEEVGEDGADLARTDPAEKDTTDEGVHAMRPPLVPRQHRRGEAVLPGARDFERERPPGGGQAPDVVPVTIPTPRAGPRVGVGLEMSGQFLLHAIFQEELDGAQALARDIAPDGRFVLDLLPQIGYGKVGQCWHTGHGRILLSTGCGVERTPSVLGPPPKVHMVAYATRFGLEFDFWSGRMYTKEQQKLTRQVQWGNATADSVRVGFNIFRRIIKVLAATNRPLPGPRPPPTPSRVG